MGVFHVRDFFTKSFMGVLTPYSLVHHLWSRIWLGVAPLKVEAFYWLAVAGKISTFDNSEESEGLHITFPIVFLCALRNPNQLIIFSFTIIMFLQFGVIS